MFRVPERFSCNFPEVFQPRGRAEARPSRSALSGEGRPPGEKRPPPPPPRTLRRPPPSAPSSGSTSFATLERLARRARPTMAGKQNTGCIFWQPLRPPEQLGKCVPSQTLPSACSRQRPPRCALRGRDALLRVRRGKAAPIHAKPDRSAGGVASNAKNAKAGGPLRSLHWNLGALCAGLIPPGRG